MAGARDEADRIQGGVTVFGDEACPFDDRLRDEKMIEGIAMVKRQAEESVQMMRLHPGEMKFLMRAGSKDLLKMGVEFPDPDLDYDLPERYRADQNLMMRIRDHLAYP